MSEKTWPADDGDILEGKEFLIQVQPVLRHTATSLGNFRKCALPKCRRARKCLGCHPLVQIGADHWSKFPPCVHTNEAQGVLMAENRRIMLEMQSDMERQGIRSD